MARKIDNPLVRRKDLRDAIARLAVEMDRRFTLTASQASMDALTAKVDRFLAAMDRTSGEVADNRRSLMI
ncbi:MAG: hypothetical protein HY928_06850 [Elusimicrobia bacterium]|nr:hypothetical protein [Elusimicrobiota bacterium]